jgi:hypothetical protein
LLGELKQAQAKLKGIEGALVGIH